MQGAPSLFWRGALANFGPPSPSFNLRSPRSDRGDFCWTGKPKADLFEQFRREREFGVGSPSHHLLRRVGHRHRLPSACYLSSIRREHALTLTQPMPKKRSMAYVCPPATKRMR
jgi:hypothetical protein